MRTTYRIIQPNGTTACGVVDWPPDPTYHMIERLVKPLLNGEWLEHVTVMYRGKRSDMFVCENGKMLGMPRNEEATGIYRAGRVRPNQHPEEVACIVGTAIVFDREVWS